MPLDILLDVLTEGDRVDVSDIASALFGQDDVVLKWGFKYKRYDVIKDPLSGRGSLRIVRVKEEYVFEDVENERLYVVKVGNTESGTSPSYALSDDTRYRLFVSREIYISFFRLFNAAKKEGLIDDNAYLAALRFIERINNRALTKLKTLFFGEDKVKQGLHKELESHPIVGHYLAEAKRQQSS